MASGLRCSIPWLLAVAIGCGGGDIDAPIPCKSGECPTAFTCVAATNLCVKGGMIGTPDAPLLDAPASDAPPSSDGGCVSDPACAGATSAGPTCSDATHHVTCSQAASGCFTVTAGPVACGPDQTCSAGACRCSAGANAGGCTAPGPFCASATSVTTCTLASTDEQGVACFEAQGPTACTSPKACPGVGPAPGCNCPVAVAGAMADDTGTRGCASAGTLACGTSGDVDVCAQDAASGCLVWTLQGGPGGAGDCSAQHLTCDPTGGPHCPSVAWALWHMPDSPTVYCSDGAQAVSCPASGATAYGQDGNYRIDVPTYTPTADTVTDSITHLMWQQSVPATMMALADARSYCAGLSLAGFSDWRLPTRIELVSLVDYGRAGLTIDTTAFSATPPSPFWSASTYVARAGEAWAVDFGDGDAFGNDVTGALYVRCVR